MIKVRKNPHKDQINRMVKAAELYYSWGLSVFPTRADPKNGVDVFDGKKPVGYSGKIHLRKWRMYQYKQRNIGAHELLIHDITAGVPFTGLSIIPSVHTGYLPLDFDGVKDEDKFFKVVEELGLPNNYEWIIRSGGGFHIDLITDKTELHRLLTGETVAPEERLKCLRLETSEGVDWLKGGEVRYSGVTAMPPGLHKSGRYYKFENCELPKTPPKTVDPAIIAKVLAKYFQPYTASKVTGNNRRVVAFDKGGNFVSLNLEPDKKKLNSRIANITKKSGQLQEGNRNEWGISLGRYVNGNGWDHEKALKIIIELVPEFDDADICVRYMGAQVGKLAVKYHGIFAEEPLSLGEPVRKLKVKKSVREAASEIFDLLDEKKRIGLMAPPSSHKTTMVMEEMRKRYDQILVVVPTTVLGKQLEEAHNVPFVWQGSELTKGLAMKGSGVRIRRALKKHGILVVTYASLYKVRKALRSDLENVAVVMDEIHVLSTQAGIRDGRMGDSQIAETDTLCERAGWVLKVTATPVTMELGHWVEVDVGEMKELRVVPVIGGDARLFKEAFMSFVVDKARKSSGLTIVYLNSKRLQEELANMLEGEGISAKAVYSRKGLQDEDIYRGIVDDNLVKDVKVLLTTSILGEGLNLKNENVQDIIVVKWGKMTGLAISQFIRRVRNPNENTTAWVIASKDSFEKEEGKFVPVNKRLQWMKEEANNIGYESYQGNARGGEKDSPNTIARIPKLKDSFGNVVEEPIEIATSVYYGGMSLNMRQILGQMKRYDPHITVEGTEAWKTEPDLPLEGAWEWKTIVGVFDDSAVAIMEKMLEEAIGRDRERYREALKTAKRGGPTGQGGKIRMHAGVSFEMYKSGVSVYVDLAKQGLDHDEIIRQMKVGANVMEKHRRNAEIYIARTMVLQETDYKINSGAKVGYRAIQKTYVALKWYFDANGKISFGRAGKVIDKYLKNQRWQSRGKKELLIGSMFDVKKTKDNKATYYVLNRQLEPIDLLKSMPKKVIKGLIKESLKSIMSVHSGSN